ncbi:MAG: FMN-binding glutamate synthase family protein [Gammaproteobacteria bacterium]|nr:MAG: FMN-binding glutamate synthase family protein [Pseudomonadota bacterium]MBC6945965.1 FMN-binding glutamate synthase family protein [Gammaproteobacteria bacterium]MCE7897019.1 FMN-binding glutamate synthase family protein [Gammaproteobacteria bacterium PRO8]MDL1881340.1 FMN-binding glutamate synthase family protein [Gammaproteobacteria bacterium PRO2]MCL4777957.1 FMN-binding glutamate synthase family protein [Gammaproteobacteria bacterium]
MNVVSEILGLFSFAFVAAIGIGAISILVIYVIDKTQTRHAIRRNYPVIGRFRYVFENVGEFFRQYFFAMDREEMPFNRAERAWVYRAAKGEENTVPFGSTRDLRPAGTAIFVNCPYPLLDEETRPTSAVTVGPGSRHPYSTSRFFHVSAMSYGAISRPAVLALSQGAHKAGCWLNTGEGGLAPYHLAGGADVVFQMGTAKYGVREADARLSDLRLAELASYGQVKMIEVKLSQGAKPGKGGILPAAKVTDEVARIRGIPPGQDSISPNRHLEIHDAGSLLDFINRVRDVSGRPTGFKTVFGGYDWLGELFEVIHRRGLDSAPDFITVDSGDGGTGAAPMTLLDNVGLPVRESLPRVVDLLREHGLRERIRVVASGKMINPVGVAWALCTGADFVNSARGFMFALGCIQAMKCNKNTCPTGITTHDRNLQRGLVVADKAERVARYALGMEKEVAVIAHSCGAAEPRLLRRQHCRIVQANGQTALLSELFPDPTLA